MYASTHPAKAPRPTRCSGGAGDLTRAGEGATWYARFTAGLARSPRAGGDLLADVDGIGTMFDKRRCHALLDNKGIPVPAGMTVTSYEELREQMRSWSWPRVFVKPAHGSSASGVIAFETSGTRSAGCDLGHGGPAQFAGGADVHGGGTVARIVDALAPDGLHVERWFPKASVAGGCFDLRVVTVAGVPTPRGGAGEPGPDDQPAPRRQAGDLGAIRSRLGERWDEVMDVCARTAACFLGSLMTGVDLMIGADWRSMAVAEVNAFGDLAASVSGALDGSGLDYLRAAQAKAIAADGDRAR